ncbi:MAG: TonB-dependent hemoglobin/transferrin/lactoferrin family receptor [Gammaproteobacteria bacterium]|nr:TonB-dependent hemoglobin/transferrin/lactoferrin family receptor [Gammaproteobacteria bacterium]
MNSTLRSAIAGVLLLAGLARAAADPAELEMVTVVGKLPEPLQGAAATVSVITAEDLELAVAFDLRDAMRGEPGISLARDPHRFGTSGVNVRGLGGNRVLVETDGVPAARTFAAGSFSNSGRQFADLELIRRIELLRGPASALYGSDAIAGVVAITTMDPADLLEPGRRFAARLRAGYAGDDQSNLAGLTLAGRQGEFDGLLAWSHREGGELDNNSDQPRANPRAAASDAVLARAVFHGFGQPVRLTLGWNRQRTLTDVDSLELSGGRFANTILMRGDDTAETRSILLDQHFAGVGPIDQGEWRLYRSETDVHQRTDEERRAAPPVAASTIQREFRYRERISGVELTLARELTTAHGPHRLIAGLDLSETRVVEQRDGQQTYLPGGPVTKTILGERLPVRDFPISRVREAGLYVQDEWRPGDGRWSLIPALRADWYRLTPRVDPLYAADNPNTEPVGIEQASLSPKLGLGFRVRQDLTLFLQYAHGFRSQPFEDVNIGLDLPQFRYRAIPNPDLRPEQSDSVEAGLRFSGTVISGSISAFTSHYRDFIESRVNLGVDPATGYTLFQSRNVARARIEGAEAALDLELGAWRAVLAGWSVRAAGSWARGEDRTRGQPLNTIDPARGTLGLRYQSAAGRLGGGVDVTWSAAKKRLADPSGTQFRPAGWSTVDLTLQWQAGERLRIQAGLFNALDRRYYDWSAVRGRLASDPLLALYREPGRHFAITAGTTF